MSRPVGRKNSDHAIEKDAIVVRVRDRLLQADGAGVSMRELARAAQVSPATLHHYFPTRDALLVEVLAREHASALPYLHHIATGPLSPLSSSLGEVIRFIVAGLVDSGLAGLHALGLQVGLRGALGPAYLSSVLEPSLQALEARLERHVAHGDIDAQIFHDPRGLRVAALQLLAPVLLAVLHQYELGGERCRALVIDDTLIDLHVAAFVRAWGTAHERSFV
jgi:AcrR family transcriptional regulator